MKKVRPKVNQILVFAGVFLVVHFLASTFFEYGSFFDAGEASGGRGIAARLLESVIVVLVATPTYFALVSWYGRRKTKRGRPVGRDGR